jgi:hypothetical protein
VGRNTLGQKDRDGMRQVVSEIADSRAVKQWDGEALRQPASDKGQCNGGTLFQWGS